MFFNEHPARLVYSIYETTVAIGHLEFRFDHFTLKKGGDTLMEHGHILRSMC